MTFAPAQTLGGTTVLIANPSPDVYGSDLQMLESITALVRAGSRVVVALPVRRPARRHDHRTGRRGRVRRFPGAPPSQPVRQGIPRDGLVRDRLPASAGPLHSPARTVGDLRQYRDSALVVTGLPVDPHADDLSSARGREHRRWSGAARVDHAAPPGPCRDRDQPVGDDGDGRHRQRPGTQGTSDLQRGAATAAGAATGPSRRTRASGRGRPAVAAQGAPCGAGGGGPTSRRGLSAGDRTGRIGLPGLRVVRRRAGAAGGATGSRRRGALRRVLQADLAAPGQRRPGRRSVVARALRQCRRRSPAVTPPGRRHGGARTSGEHHRRGHRPARAGRGRRCDGQSDRPHHRRSGTGDGHRRSGPGQCDARFSTDRYEAQIVELVRSLVAPERRAA